MWICPVSGTIPAAIDYGRKYPGVILTMRYLGLTANEGGMCYGIAAMAIQAAKRGDLGAFLNRMDLFDRFDSQAELNTALEAALAKRKTKEPLTTDEKLICSIPAFLEGVSLFHSSTETIDLDSASPDPARKKAAHHLSEVYTALGIAEQDYLEADAFFNPAPEDSIKHFASEESHFLASDLENRLDDLASTTGDLAIGLGNPDHQIALMRCESGWALVDHDNITRSDDLSLIKSKAIKALELNNIEMTLVDIHYHMGNEAEITGILRDKPINHSELSTKLIVLEYYESKLLAFMHANKTIEIKEALVELRAIVAQSEPYLSSVEWTCYVEKVAVCLSLYKDDGVSILHDKIKAGDVEDVEAYFDAVRLFAEDGIFDSEDLRELLLSTDDDDNPAILFAVLNNEIEVLGKYFISALKLFEFGLMNKEDFIRVLEAKDKNGFSFLDHVLEHCHEDIIHGYLSLATQLANPACLTKEEVATILLNKSAAGSRMVELLLPTPAAHGIVKEWLMSVAKVDALSELGFVKIVNISKSLAKSGHLKGAELVKVLQAANADGEPLLFQAMTEDSLPDLSAYFKVIKYFAKKGFLSSSDVKDLFLSRDASGKKAILGAVKAGRMDVVKSYHSSARELMDKGLLTPQHYKSLILTRKQYKRCELNARILDVDMPEKPKLSIVVGLPVPISAEFEAKPEVGS